MYASSLLAQLVSYRMSGIGLQVISVVTTIVTVGTTYFVAPDGSDSGPGSADRPWATINHAAETAVAGDTVVVRGGQYLLSAQVRPRNSGRPDAWITFIGYPGEEPILDAQSIPQPPLPNGI